jgi:hypothetical protein
MSRTWVCDFIVTMLLMNIMNHSAEASGPDTPTVSPSHAAASEAGQTVHTSEQFSFLANGPLADVFPVFGADREREWAPGWEPRFIWPAQPNDRAGMVFQIAHGNKVGTWVSTVFDRAAGRVQYVYVLPEVVATVITIELHARGAATEVVVRYERTSLSSESGTVVKHMAERDRLAGPEWSDQINNYLSRTRMR